MRVIHLILAAAALTAIAPLSAAESPVGAWSVSTKRDLLDGSASVIASVRSETAIANVIGLQSTAALYLRCRTGVFEAYVAWPNFLGLDDVPARYRIGSSPIVNATWSGSTTGDSAFISNPAEFAARLSGQSELVISLEAWAATSQSVVFHIEGVDSVLVDLKRSCPAVAR